MTPLDAARVNRTIFHNHSVCIYIYLKVRFRYRRRHAYARNARTGMHAPCSFVYLYPKWVSWIVEVYEFWCRLYSPVPVWDTWTSQAYIYQVSLPSQAYIRSQCTYRHACSMLVRIFVYRVGAISSINRSLRMLMRQYQYEMLERRRHIYRYARNARTGMHAPCSFEYMCTGWVSLFERSEFLIATCKKKKTDRLCVCSAELGFSVEKLSWF